MPKHYWREYILSKKRLAECFCNRKRCYFLNWSFINANWKITSHNGNKLMFQLAENLLEFSIPEIAVVKLRSLCPVILGIFPIQIQIRCFSRFIRTLWIYWYWKQLFCKHFLPPSMAFCKCKLFFYQNCKIIPDIPPLD
jgi:hypothetical protein